LPAVFLLGASMAGMLIVLCWLPDISTSFAQLCWHMARVRSGSIFAKGLRLLTELTWTRWWILFLIAVTLTLLVPAAAVWIRLLRDRTSASPAQKLWMIAAGFSAAGLVSVFGAAANPYYLVYFTPWPVVALSILAVTRAPSPAMRRVVLIAVTTGLVVWLPSLARNVFGVSQAARYYSRLSSEPFARRLALAVPPGVRVTGTPELFVFARQANVDFAPLPFFSEQSRVAAGEYILLTEEDLIDGFRVRRESLSNRPVLFRGSVFPSAGKYHYPVILLGSVSQVAQLAGAQEQSPPGTLLTP
jgi:hypothetical protein